MAPKNDAKRRLYAGHKFLRGNRWKSLFGQSNYQRAMRQYKKKYVQVRPDPANPGQTLLWDTRTNQATTEEGISFALTQEVTGSKTPFKDLKYLNIKAAEAAVRNQGKGWRNPIGGGRDLSYNIQRLLTPKLYNAQGELIGREKDLQTKTKADKLKIQAQEASLGTSYDEFLDPNSPAYKGSEEIGTQVDGIPQGPLTGSTPDIVGETTIGGSTSEEDTPVVEEQPIEKDKKQSNTNKVTISPKKQESNEGKGKENLKVDKSKGSIYGLTREEWQKASKNERRRAKRLSNNNSRAPLRGKGTVREMLGFTD